MTSNWTFSELKQALSAEFHSIRMSLTEKPVRYNTDLKLGLFEQNRSLIDIYRSVPPELYSPEQLARKEALRQAVEKDYNMSWAQDNKDTTARLRLPASVMLGLTFGAVHAYTTPKSSLQSRGLARLAPYVKTMAFRSAYLVPVMYIASHGRHFYPAAFQTGRFSLSDNFELKTVPYGEWASGEHFQKDRMGYLANGVLCASMLGAISFNAVWDSKRGIGGNLREFFLRPSPRNLVLPLGVFASCYHTFMYRLVDNRNSTEAGSAQPTRAPSSTDTQTA